MKMAYSYNLKNTGNVTFQWSVHGGRRSAGNLPGNSQPGSEAPPWTCTATYAVTQADLDAGFIKNTAKGHAFSAAPVDSNEARRMSRPRKMPALSLTRTATPATSGGCRRCDQLQLPGQEHRQRDPRRPVAVADDKATVTCPAGGLAPGASMTCTASYRSGRPTSITAR